MTEKSNSAILARRGELLAEMFLRDLKPSSLGRPNPDVGFDFLVGFNNSTGRVNTFGVEVKGTEEFESSSYPLEKSAYRRFTASNVPVFLLVVDVKKNRLFFAWPGSSNGNSCEISRRVKIPVIEINDKTRKVLGDKLTQ